MYMIKKEDLSTEPPTELNILNFTDLEKIWDIFIFITLFYLFMWYIFKIEKNDVIINIIYHSFPAVICIIKEYIFINSHIYLSFFKKLYFSANLKNSFSRINIAISIISIKDSFYLFITCINVLIMFINTYTYNIKKLIY